MQIGPCDLCQIFPAEWLITCQSLFKVLCQNLLLHAAEYIHPELLAIMPPKRGRPVSHHTDDPVILERRRKNAERQMQYYNRKKAAQAVNTPVKVEQLQQGELIIDLGFTNEDAEPTPSQLGLRVPPDVRLAEDPSNSLQSGAVEVDEHEGLYQDQEVRNDDYTDYYQVTTPPRQSPTLRPLTPRPLTPRPPTPRPPTPRTLTPTPPTPRPPTPRPPTPIIQTPTPTTQQQEKEQEQEQGQDIEDSNNDSDSDSKSDYQDEFDQNVTPMSDLIEKLCDPTKWFSWLLLEPA